MQLGHNVNLSLVSVVDTSRDVDINNAVCFFINRFVPWRNG